MATTHTDLPPLTGEARRRPEWLKELPVELHPLLHEVYASLEIGTRALPAMGIRAVIDQVAVLTVGDVGTFPQKLEALERRGIISKVQREWLAVVIDAGNAASHRGLMLEPPELHHMMDCLEHLLRGLFAFKAPTRALRKVIPKRRRRRARPHPPP